MAIANPVYANAAFGALVGAAASSVSAGVITEEDSTLFTAATNFAAAVDAAIVTAQGVAFDPTVSSAAGVTVVPATAAEANALSTKPLVLSQICAKALGNAYASSGGQTPTVTQFSAAATTIAASFKAAVTAANGWTTT
jgi:hypothetical protein